MGLSLNYITYNHPPSLTGAKADPDQYFVPIYEQLNRLILNEKAEGKRENTKWPPGNPVAYSELEFSYRLHTCSLALLCTPRGSEAGEST